MNVIDRRFVLKARISMLAFPAFPPTHPAKDVGLPHRAPTRSRFTLESGSPEG